MSSPPKTLTSEECDRLLIELHSRADTKARRVKSIRNHTIGLLMLDAGLRVGEVCSLRILDLWIQHEPVQSLCIRSEIAKGGHERLIPMTPRLQTAIKRMQDKCWQAKQWYGGYAFCRDNYNDTNLTARQIERIIKKAAIQSIGRAIHPHMLRHTFASRLMRTTNARIVQELLGHRRLTSTQIYTHPNHDDLTKAIDSLQS